MSSNNVFTRDDIDGELCQFEHGQTIGNAFELLRYEDYPEEFRGYIDEINKRGQTANEMYRMASHREQMFASGFQAGMYIARFDENEELISFEFTDGTRRMLGYDGLDDLPNEFESWVKTLIPDERETLVKLFWDTVKIHRELPDIAHAEYRMMKKDGSIIWVTGAGEFVRREDGSLEIYMGCYREVTAEHEKEEHLRIIEGVGKVFNFSIYIDAKTEEYRMISSNEYVDKVERCRNAFDFLKANVTDSVSEEYIDELKEWFNGSSILQSLKEHETISKDFYSKGADQWFKGVFIVSDYDENGEIAHIIYGCQNIDDTKRAEIESQKEILSQYNLLKSISEIYHSMHEIDLTNNTVVAYKAGGPVEKSISNTDGAAQMMREAIIAMTEPQYVAQALEFTDLTTLPNRMRNRKYLTAEFKGINIGWFKTSFIAVEHDAEGRATKVIFTTRSIDDIKRKEEKLIFKSNTDELTGAYNRRAYEDTIAELDKNGINKDLVYIAFDVNGLKIVNDTIGHSAGDELIIGASSSLIRTIGRYGKIFRTGGDEFVAVIIASDEQLMSALETLDTTVDNWKGRLVDELSISYGFVTGRELPDQTIHDIAVLADKRMYESKAAHYKKKGIDRRGQAAANTALCNLYTKILKINLTNDTYSIVSMDASEQTEEKGFADSISAWLHGFGKSGQVHKDDIDEYLKKTDIEYLKEYFNSGKTSISIFYKRKFADGFKQAAMEMIPADDYEADNQTLFLYVKNIDI